jgi:hypothetical protein
VAKAGTTQEVNLFFDFNKNNLAQDEGAKLSDLIQQYKENRFQIVLRGYADTIGRSKYNMELSKQRAVTVRDFLIAKGVEREHIAQEFFGEQKAKEDQLFNRRVSVYVSKGDNTKLTSYHQVIESITPQKEIRAITPTQTNVIKGKKGTNVTIPANAFVDRHGNPVTGTVVVEISEYYSTADYISKGLSTISEGQLLVSGGVVDIRAYSDTTELFLKDTMKVKIDFPKSTDKKYSTFYGEPQADGSMNWKPDKKFKIEEDIYNYDTLGIDRSSPIIIIRRTIAGDKAVIYDKNIKDYRLMTEADSTALDMFNNSVKVSASYFRGDGEIRENETEASKKIYNELHSSKLKWINCDYFYKDPSVLFVNYFIRIGNPGLKAEKAFLIYDDIKSVVQIPFFNGKYRLNGQFPTARPSRLLITGTTSEGKLFYYFDKITLQQNKAVKVTLQEISFDNFTSLVKTI